MIIVRPATADDAALLLGWANEPTTRAAGYHPEPIDPDTHRRWLADRLGAPGRRLYIGLDDGMPVGPVRIDIDADGRAEVGISVAPAARGRGVGRGLLAAGLAAALADTVADAARADADAADLPIRTFVARIRPDNAASLALFRGAGFRDAGRGTVHGEPCLILERPARPDPRVVRATPVPDAHGPA